MYDVIVLGGGPAGLSAALYAGRARLSVLLIEKGAIGGQIVQSSEIENYPGALPQETGESLIARLSAQAERFGAARVLDTVTAVSPEGETKLLTGAKGSYRGRTLIVATGAAPMHIGCPGERELVGKGVSYCATCDAAFFEGLEVYVVGGGDSAVEEALYLSKFARKVTVIHRRDALRAAKCIQERAFAEPKLSFLLDSVVEELRGDGLLERMTLKNVKTGALTTVAADEADGTFGLFVFVGLHPASELFAGKLDTESGYILTDESMSTNLPGVFAAGDVRKKTLRQVVTAAADGAVAAVSAERYIEAAGL
ncbi:MAG: FAD-dependent oxidoreductase [Clostridiales Family XIII bacterium]|jgi:thioredoxin reductase (NADPH)|nr:FAD-dependent oxidoreductase [Clostridiales Family XIII bacterium]